MYSLSTCWNSHRHSDGRAMLREIKELGFEYAELSHGTRISLLPGILEAVDAGEIKISSLHNFCPLPMGVNNAAPNLYQFSSERPRERELAVRYTLKTPYRDGTTHVIFEPLDFLARLAALVPRPRVHLTRFHGVFAPHSALRAQVTPAGRGSAAPPTTRTPAERHRAMSWAQRLKRVFRIDIESCERCGGKVRIIASIEDAALIGKILAHLEQREGASSVPADDALAHGPRGPPRQREFDLG